VNSLTVFVVPGPKVLAQSGLQLSRFGHGVTRDVTLDQHTSSLKSVL
jgi:hypothetical protein